MSRIIGNLESEEGFYIGDPCYVMGHSTYHGYWEKEKGFKSGVYPMGGDCGFAVAGTGGDGTFLGMSGLPYSVDTGTIGAVSLELVRRDPRPELGGTWEKALESMEWYGRIIREKRIRFDADCNCILIKDEFGGTIELIDIHQNDGYDW